MSLMRVWVVGVALSTVGCHRAAPPPEPAAAELVSMLQDLDEEYGEALETYAPEDLGEVDALAGRLVAETAAHRSLRRYLPRVREVAELVLRRKQPYHVDDLGRALEEELLARERVATSPAHTPDKRRGAQLFTVACAACHGAEGRLPPGALAADLRQPETVNSLSPYRVYNAVTYGVHGTKMPAFGTLSADDRWSLAFYVMALRQPACPAAPPKPPVAQLATASDSLLMARYGEAQLPCLRAF